jgi:hypothetical protein
MSPTEAGQAIRLSEALAERRTDTAVALAEGSVSLEQARAIVDVVRKLPDQASAAEQVQVEKFLLGKSDEMHADDIRATLKTFENIFDPDGLEPMEEKAKAKRAAHIEDHHDRAETHSNHPSTWQGDGTHSLHWRDVDANIAMLKAALESLSAPRPADADGVPDSRTPAVRRADALVDLIAQALRFGENLPASHGARPHIVVTISDTDLRNGGGFGVTATGEKISVSTVRRLACDAVLSPLRINGDGIPLNLGRKRRTVSPGQWIALVARDGGCVFPNCDRPAGWCDAHHTPEWENGGRTDLDKMPLLCGRHHDAVHDGWEVRFAEDGHPELIPPPWVDSQQRPRRNLRWRRSRSLFDSGDPVP